MAINKSWRGWLIIVGLLCATLGLSACSGTSTNTNATSSAVTAEAIITTTPDISATTIVPAESNAGSPATTVASSTAPAQATSSQLVTTAPTTITKAEATKTASATTPAATSKPGNTATAPVNIGAASILKHEISPAKTDPAINQNISSHFAYFNSAGVSSGKLYVHFVGSFGKPSSSLQIYEEGAQQGYHVIGLDYPNDWTVDDKCSDSSDKDCFTKVRQEILDGQDRTPEVAVNPANSIENRLIKLLVYLNQTYPGEQWSQFIESNQPKWNLIRVGGHSQGAGHAAFVGKIHPVDRVIMFGGTADAFGGARLSFELANWISQPGATPADKYYGFNHQQDRSYRRTTAAYGILGMDKFGKNVVVDGKTSFDNSHILSTQATPGQPGEYHGSVVVDRNLPKASDGSPLFLKVWDYLCFA